jgi:antitoxin HicB
MVAWGPWSSSSKEPDVKTASIKSEIPHYLALPYTCELVREDDGSWFARGLEFPGCMTVGDSRDEGLEMLDDAVATWIESKLKHHEMIPAPMSAPVRHGRKQGKRE